MKVEKTPHGYWLASGSGIGRYIVSEGDTRGEAFIGWVVQFMQQVDAMPKVAK